MSLHRRTDTLTTIKAVGLVPLFYHPDGAVASQVLDACAAGGARFVEFTNRGDRALDVFKALALYRDQYQPDVILGAGSVCDAQTAAMYLGAGADAVISPVLDVETAKICNRRKIPYVPGCGTVTEIQRAHQFGVDICKVFPAGQVGGPDFIRAVRAPCPWAELMPTGGVAPTRENLKAWFDAGAACVGMGSKLVPAELSGPEAFTGLTNHVKETLEIIRNVRPQALG